MKRIADEAEYGNAYPTEKGRKAVVSKSVLKEGALENGYANVENKTHGFSKSVAQTVYEDDKTLGYASAIVLRYLSFMARKYGSNVDGKKWVRINLDFIASQYSYLGRSTVDDAILRLKKAGACETKNLNAAMGRPQFDRTRWYHVPQKWMNMAEEEIRYFDSALAGPIGIPAAAIYFNFMHWVNENYPGASINLSPSTIMTLQPFDRSTVKRAIATLKAERMIVPTSDKGCWYVKGPVDLPGSKPDENGSNPDKVGSNPDEIGSNPDNDISCREVIEELKECSKIEAAPPSENFVSFVEKQICSSASDIKDDVMPVPEEQDRVVLPVPPSCWPIVESLSALHDMNKSLARSAAALEKAPKNRDLLLDIVQKVSTRFLAQFDLGWLDELYDEATDDEIFEALFPKYLDFFQQAKVSADSSVFALVYYGAFGCVMGAFLRSHGGRSYTHPNALFIRIEYSIHLIFWKRAESRRLAAIEEELKERQHEFASRDVELELLDDLSPAEKTRVFKQGLFSRNKVGGIHFDQVHRIDEIKITKSGLTAIHRLFSMNPALTSGELLSIMDGCLALHRSQPVPTQFRKGVKWHARMGFNLTLFARNLSAIVKQLGITCDSLTTFLGDRPSLYGYESARPWNAVEAEFCPERKMAA